MEHIKNIIAKLIVGKTISDSDIKRIILGKNSVVIEKISKNLEQTSNIAKAIKSNPDMLKDILKNKAITEIFKYTKKNK